MQAAERRTAQAVADNAAIADEVDSMRAALERLQAESQKAANSPNAASSPHKGTPSASKVEMASFLPPSWQQLSKP